MADNNIKKARNPQQRNLFLALGVGALVVLGVGIYFAKGNSQSQQPAGANVATVPPVNAVPGTSTSPDYNKRVQESNDQQAQQALNQGTTFIPTVTGQNNMANTSPLDLIDKQKEEAARKAKEAEEARAAEELARVQQEERDRLAQQPVVINIQPTPQPVAPAPVVKKPKYTNEDYILLSAIINAQRIRSPHSEFDYAGQTLEENEPTANNTINNGGNGIQGTQVSNNIQQQAQGSMLPFAKAGTIFNAVLETAVNSDEPGPVLAKIVSGPMKGTRLIGSMQNVGERVVLQFSTASLPNMSTSTKISAVAVDPDTSRTALASDVDHHYFARYGILLASSFLSGWSNAIANQNSTTYVTDSGTIVRDQGQLDSKQINRQAFGQVGTELANSVRQNTQNIKPTVTVDAGIAIGILLVDDFVLTPNQ